LRQPMIQASGLNAIDCADGAIRHLEFRRKAATCTATRIDDLTIIHRAGHRGVMIRKVGADARSPYRQSTRRVETHEPDPRAPRSADVRPDVDFGKVDCRRNTGRRTRPGPLHPEWNDAEPAHPIEGIHL